MTEKQLKILATALRLFASKGVDSTSTSLIAKEAGVSEGLIFRHFKNKEGLLEAVLDMGYSRATEFFESLLSNEDPLTLIHTLIETPINIPEEEHEFWKLTYALKWQRGHYNTDLTEPLLAGVEKAFESLGYSNPREEAEILLVFMDGIVFEILLKQSERAESIVKHFKSKYTN